MGPKHPTPAGAPISMVHVTAPDLHRYPRFAAALDVAQVAELVPGDAIFIPRDWFHHVEALERFNVLVNYWWDAEVSQRG
jgi:oxalate decarboxylase/phosphoglucose isomerase-like protein (cupin superfamily)